MPAIEEKLHKELLEYARDVVKEHGIRIENISFNWDVHHSLDNRLVNAVVQDVKITSSYSGKS